MGSHPKRPDPDPDWLAQYLSGLATAPADATRVRSRIPTAPKFPASERTIGADRPVLGRQAAPRGNTRHLETVAPGVEGYTLSDVLRDLVSGRTGGLLADVAPVVGDARGLHDALELRQQGHPILGAGVAATTAIPGVDKIAKEIAKKVIAAGGKREAARAIPTAKDKFAVLTGENPGGKQASAKKNAVARAKTTAEVIARGYNPTPIRGAYTDEATGQLLTERGLYVPGMPPRAAELVARRADQNSIATNEGLHDLTSGGLLYPARGVTPTTGAPYTELPGGSRFALDIPEWNKQPPRAPYVLVPPQSGDVFDASRLGPDVPAGVSTARPPVKYPTERANTEVLGDIPGRMRKVYTPMVEHALREYPQAAGWYDLSQMRDAMMDLSPTGAQDFRQFALFTGPTSTGTNVPQELRQASMFYHLWKNGLLDEKALRDGTLKLPAGYMNRRQHSVNAGILRILKDGNLDPLEQPKTFRHANQAAGDFWGGTTLDMHVGRQVGEVGLMRNEAGERVPGVGFPEPSYHEKAYTTSSPPNRHYPLIEDAMIEEANRIGMAPAPYMAAGWVGGAQATGVDDARTMLEILNERFRATAEKYGKSSPTEAFRAFARGEIPLWAMMGMTLGGGGLLNSGGVDAVTAPEGHRGQHVPMGL